LQLLSVSGGIPSIRNLRMRHAVVTSDMDSPVVKIIKIKGKGEGKFVFSRMTPL
jgi:hypothetical protein